MSGHKGKQAKNTSNNSSKTYKHYTENGNVHKESTSKPSSETPEPVCLVAPFHKNTILTTIGGKKTPALVDTGASISCLSKTFLDKTEYKDATLTPCALKEIIGVGGERHQVLGQTKIQLHIANVNISFPFYVLNTVHHSVILGMDFLKYHKVVIDLEAGTVFIRDSVVSASLIRTKAGYARAAKPTFVPAESEVEMSVKISKRHTNDIVLLEPAPTLQHLGLGGAKCLVKVNKSKAIFRVVNPSDQNINIPVNRIVASVCDIDSEHVHLLDGSKPDPNSYPSVNKISVNDTDDPELSFNISNSNLSEDEKITLKKFLLQNKDVFSSSLADIGKSHLYQHRIETFPDSPPVRTQFYRQPPHLKAETDRQVNEMLEHGIIQQSNSLYNSPVVLVKKKDNSWRFAVDYRKLNKITIPISHPIPRLDDVFDAIGESHASVFSILDLNSAYFQIELDPETRHKSAFVTHDGVYEFLRMSFGLRNAPASFQMLMSRVLKGLNWKFVLCYIDDILVFSANFSQHLEHLGQVFQRLREANLTLKSSKCNFAVDRVVYLGHVITKEGVQVDVGKTEKVNSFPAPKTQKELKGFLGLCNYYRRFVKDFSKICIPLNRLLTKDQHKKFAEGDWTQECQNAFDKLKIALTTAPVLAYPDMNKPFVLSTDASGYAIGYVLGQLDASGKEHVIAYGGRALRPDERKWCVTELECLAVVQGIETYKHYLSQHKFKVYTDHKALQWLENIKNPTGRLGRWAMKLQASNFEIVHRSGNRNQNADFLSRLSYDEVKAEDQDNASSQVFVVSEPYADTENLEPTPFFHMQDQTDPQICPAADLDEAEGTSDTNSIEVTFEYPSSPKIAVVDQEVPEPEPEMVQMQQQCDDFKDIYTYLQDQTLPEDEKHAKYITIEANQYVIKDGTLYHVFQPRARHHAGNDLDRLILQLALPKEKRLDVLKAYHDCQAGGGHFGVNRTFGAIRLKYWWPKMYQMIQDYVQNCDVCQRIKVDRHRQPAPLNPLPVEEVFSRIHMDILGPLPKTKEGFQYCLVIVDSFSKWCESFALKTQEATEVASVL